MIQRSRFKINPKRRRLQRGYVTEAVTYTVTFDVKGGSPAPATQKIAGGGVVVKPVDPTKGDSIFGGWSQSSGSLYNFKSIINGNVLLTARWGLYPKQYIALSSGDGQYNASIIRNNFGAAQGKNIVVATQPLFRVFERDVNTVLVPSIRRHLAEAEQYDVPIMIFLGVMPFNKVRPDLFNWWDQQAPDPTGKRITNKNNYNPANVNNVEWTGWDASKAVKIVG